MLPSPEIQPVYWQCGLKMQGHFPSAVGRKVGSQNPKEKKGDVKGKAGFLSLQL